MDEKLVMYEGQFKRSFHRSNGVRAWSILGRWLCIGVALGLCFVGCFACRVHCEPLHVVEVDKAYNADSDSCTVEIWRQCFPRRVTKFRIKK